MHVRRPDERLLRDYPVAFYVFDLLQLDGRTLMGEPYHQRRDHLAELGLDQPPRFRVPGRYEHASAGELLDIAAQHGLEGIVAKRRDSRYQPGRRSRHWIKTPLRLTQEVILGGWTPGGGRRAGTIGSLLPGVYDEDHRLTYAGHVGTGFSDAALEPVLVGEVEHRQWTSDGRLRHPSWRGFGRTANPPR